MKQAKRPYVKLIFGLRHFVNQRGFGYPSAWSRSGLACQGMVKHDGFVQWSNSIEINTLFAGFALLKKALDGRAFAAECPNCGSIQPIEAKDCGEDGPCYVCLTCEVDWHFPHDDSEATGFDDGDDIPF